MILRSKPPRRCWDSHRYHGNVRSARQGRSIRHLILSATGGGGNAPEDAFYLTVVPPQNDGKTIHKLTIKGDVPVDGFWSISVYGADGYFHKNEQNTYNINGTTAKKDADGSITIQFGGCDGAAKNCIPITPAGITGHAFIDRARKFLTA